MSKNNYDLEERTSKFAGGCWKLKKLHNPQLHPWGGFLLAPAD